MVQRKKIDDRMRVVAFSSPAILYKISASSSICSKRLLSSFQVTIRPLAVNRLRFDVVCTAALPKGVVRDAVGLPVIDFAPVRRYPPLWILALVGLFVLYLLRRYQVYRHLRTQYRRRDLAGDIGAFYDARSAAWESVWGPHMHHGLYDTVDGKRLRGRAAQERTMTEMLSLALLPSPSARALDIGCGIGGGSRFLAEHFEYVDALTLSPEQATRANEINKEAGLGDRIRTHVADVLKWTPTGTPYDLVWALESGEHIAPKGALASAMRRALRPGGVVVMAAWCVRQPTTPLTTAEQYSLRRVMEEYCLPPLSPPSEYESELIRAGFRNVKVVDWTERAAPFWREVAFSAVTPAGISALRRYGWPLFRSALAMRHVMRAIDLGAFRLVAFSGCVPTAAEVEEEEANAIVC